MTGLDAALLAEASANVTKAWHHERRAARSLSPSAPADWWDRIAAEYDRLAASRPEPVDMAAVGEDDTDPRPGSPEHRAALRAVETKAYRWLLARLGLR
jgi:hypothetical protein